jgi:hypothetical protein
MSLNTLNRFSGLYHIVSDLKFRCEFIPQNRDGYAYDIIRLLTSPSRGTGKPGMMISHLDILAAHHFKSKLAHP